MIVRCQRDMTETSSTPCFLRCFARCLGLDNRRSTKTTLEPLENGFSHLGNEEKSNGNATVVKLCEPNANRLNKKSDREKTCCVMNGGNTDGLRYAYEPVTSTSSKELNGFLIAHDTLSNDNLGSIDAKSDEVLIASEQPFIINQKDSVKKPKSLDDGQSELDTPELLPVHNGNVSISSEVQDGQFSALEQTSLKDFSSKMNNGIMFAKNEPDVAAELEVTSENRDLYCKDCSVDSNVVEETARVCNGSIPHTKPNNVPAKFQGDNNEGKTIKEGGNGTGEHDISYFKNLVETETIRLNDLIQKWEKVLTDEPEIHDEVRDEIRSVNGQTHLVISERFSQFKSLIEQSEKQANGELKDTKIITLTDLQGFWDMIYFQVQDVLVKFQRLDKVQDANWNYELLHENGKKPQPVKKTKRAANGRTKRPPKTATSQSSNASEEEKARRLAARKRLAEARKKMAAKERPQSISDENFIVE